MKDSEILWLDLQPSLAGFNCRLVKNLSKSRVVKRWSFHHDPDEACTIETIQKFLCESVSGSPNSSPHIVAHGVSGTIACMIACQQPKIFRSLTLLSVDANTANHWTSHYHVMRQQLPCSREQILMHLSPLLFNIKEKNLYYATAKLLEKCLDFDFVLSSIVSNALGGYLERPPIPTLVINGESDFVVDKNANERWKSILKPGDCYQTIKAAKHFFHFHNAVEVAEKINSFLDMVPENSVTDTSLSNYQTSFEVFS